MKIELDEYEQGIEDSLARGEWTRVKNHDQMVKRLRAAAKLTIEMRKKDKRINIRMSSADYYLIQKKAAEEGLPYQTLMASVLHKYAAGYLVDRRDK